MSYLVNLDKFYGPLDLLLYLLEKDEMDIYDIPIALITDQYIEYIHSSGNIDLDHMGDFLIMASYLLNLKSRLLLPGLVATEAEYEGPDPREELVDRILEYKKFRQAGDLLGSFINDEIHQVFFRDGQEHLDWLGTEFATSLKVLHNAWLSVRDKVLYEPEYNLPQGDIDIRETMGTILKALPPDGTFVVFHDLFTGISSRREGLAYFLALLELIRLQEVDAVQDERFGDIRLFKRVAVDNVDAG